MDSQKPAVPITSTSHAEVSTGYMDSTSNKNMLEKERSKEKRNTGIIKNEKAAQKKLVRIALDNQQKATWYSLLLTFRIEVGGETPQFVT